MWSSKARLGKRKGQVQYSEHIKFLKNFFIIPVEPVNPSVAGDSPPISGGEAACPSHSHLVDRA